MRQVNRKCKAREPASLGDWLNAPSLPAVKISSHKSQSSLQDRHRTEPMHKNNHKLRIGIVGAGNIVRTRHLPALTAKPDVEIVAVSNSTYESSEKFCSENARHHFSDVPAYAAFFLGQTTPVNDAAAHGS